MGAAARRARVPPRSKRRHRVRVEQPLPVYNQLAATPEPLLRCFADALCHLGTPNLRGFNQSLVVFAGEHSDVLRESRWSKGDVRSFLMEHARRTIADLKRAGRRRGRSSPPTSTRTSTPSSAPRTSSSSAQAARPEAGRPACPAGAISGPGASPPSSTSHEDRRMKLFDPTSTRASAPSPWRRAHATSPACAWASSRTPSSTPTSS